jgi:S1-C subfamily serine protease
LEPAQNSKKPRLSALLIVTIVVVSLLAGGLIGYSISALTGSGNLNDLQDQVSALQQNVRALQSALGSADENSSLIVGDGIFLSQLYAEVKDSVVIVRGLTIEYDVFRRPYYSQVQGSGFTCNPTGSMVVVTNNHVVQDAINITVTFKNGNGYAATILGADPYADLAVLSTDAPQSEYKPLEIVDSSTLEVGDFLIAVGTPYGLAGSMTTGIVSSLGRTITEDLSGGYPIANVIQTSTPINPGNSGGPLLNSQGKVVGITTAIVTDSEGLGFAIPSSTVLREIGSLVAEGSYTKHSWLGASGTDMTYEIAQAMNVDTTYGWLIAQVTSGGPADSAGLKGGTRQTAVGGQTVVLGGDIVTAFDGTRIKDMDDLSTYLEDKTMPGQTISVTVIRNGETLTVSLKVGTRPTST